MSTTINTNLSSSSNGGSNKQGKISKVKLLFQSAIFTLIMSTSVACANETQTSSEVPVFTQAMEDRMKMLQSIVKFLDKKDSLELLDLERKSWAYEKYLIDERAAELKTQLEQQKEVERLVAKLEGLVNTNYKK